MAVTRSIKATPSAVSRLAPVGIHLAGKAFVNLGCGGVACNGFEHLDGALKESKGKARERGVLTSASARAVVRELSGRLAPGLMTTALSDNVLRRRRRRRQSQTTFRCASTRLLVLLAQCRC
jgi:hypothetical protein